VKNLVLQCLFYACSSLFAAATGGIGRGDRGVVGMYRLLQDGSLDLAFPAFCALLDYS